MQYEQKLADTVSSFSSDIPLLSALYSHIPELSLLDGFDFTWA